MLDQGISNWYLPSVEGIITEEGFIAVSLKTYDVYFISPPIFVLKGSDILPENSVQKLFLTATEGGKATTVTC